MIRGILLFAGLCVTASAANAIVVVNSSFETGVTPPKSELLLAGDTTSITGWKVFEGTVDIVDSATGGWDASDGVKSVDLNGVGPGGILQTVHFLTPGLAYQVTFDLSGSYTGVRTADNFNSMTVSADGSAPASYTYDLANLTTNMMYQSLTYDFTAVAANTVIKFIGTNSGAYGAVLDNVGVQLASGSGPVLGPPGGVGSAPEPTAWAMMLAGFGLVGMSVRRRATSRSVAA